MLHKLKRAVAVACLLATACFVIVWMRSLKQWDNILYVDSSLGILEAGSSDGMLGFSHGHSDEFKRPEGSSDLGFHVMTTARLNTMAVPLLRGPRLHSDQWIDSIFIPFWLLIAVSGSVGILSAVQRPFRFSLRTLGIAATLIVLTLGLGVAASRLTWSETVQPSHNLLQLPAIIPSPIRRTPMRTFALLFLGVVVGWVANHEAI